MRNGSRCWGVFSFFFLFVLGILFNTSTHVLALLTNIRKCLSQFMLLWAGCVLEWVLACGEIIKAKIESMNKLF